MQIRIGYDIEYGISAPTGLLCMLEVHPSRAHDLIEGGRVNIEPACEVRRYVDVFGNACHYFSVPRGTERVRLHGTGLIRDSGMPDAVHADARQHRVEELPTELLQFLLPSRYCEVDSELMQHAWNTFGPVAEGWPRVQAICDYVHQHLKFDYGKARATRTALEAWRERVGVCRDFTHLAVTLCRCMNIPARYATGYLGDIGIPPQPYPMDFSAWFEVWLDGRWHTFDARHNTPRIGRVVIAYGRDATDVPIAMMFGAHTLKKFEVVTDEA